MRVPTERQKVRLVSGDTECAAWHYAGTNGACVIMAGGFAVTKEPGTDLFAKRFNDAGFAILAFDYRHLGDSGGQPRQVARIREQLADWQAAIAFATTLPGVDPTRLAIWGFSVSGGHVFRVAARNPELAAAIAQTPNANGQAAARNAARHQRPLALLRFTGRAVLQDQSALAGPAVRVAERAPCGELVRIPGGHYEPFLGGHEQAADAVDPYRPLQDYLGNGGAKRWQASSHKLWGTSGPAGPRQREQIRIRLRRMCAPGSSTGVT